MIQMIYEHFLWVSLCRNGLQQRRNSWQDGVYGTTCAIPPLRNFTYVLQAKDQIGTYFYFPSTAFHKAAGAFGGIRIWSRPGIPVPFAPPAGDFTVLAGDWFNTNHYVSILSSFQVLPSRFGFVGVVVPFFGDILLKLVSHSFLDFETRS